jgi:hypothetical protein
VISPSPLIVGLTVRGTANPGLHYAPLPTTVTIPPNQRSVSLALHPMAPAAPGGPTTVLIELDHSASRGYLLGPDHRVQVALVGVAPK